IAARVAGGEGAFTLAGAVAGCAGAELAAAFAFTLALGAGIELALAGAVATLVGATLTFTVARRRTIEFAGARARAFAFRAGFELTRTFAGAFALGRWQAAGALDLTLAAGLGLGVDHAATVTLDRSLAGIDLGVATSRSLQRGLGTDLATRLLEVDG